MKLLHLIKTSTGASWAYRLMRNLVLMGNEVHVAMPLNGELVKKYVEAGIIVHEIKFSCFKIFNSIIALRKLVRDIKPDIIHSHFFITTVIMRLALVGIKVKRIFQVPGPLHLEYSFFRNMEICLANDRDYWIATCKWTENRYKQCGIDYRHLFLSFYGGDIDNNQYERGRLRKELGLDENAFLVGMVAFMYPPKYYLGQKTGLKGHEDLIDAISMIQHKYDNLHLVFVGGAWGDIKYYDKVVKYGKAKVRNIHFLGTRKDVPYLYQDFDLAVCPSHSENLGAAAESILYGIPTIATNVGGLPDIVIPGKTGYLVSPFCSQELANKIEYVIGNINEAIQLAQNGKKILTNALNSKNTSAEVNKIYNIIINDKT